MRNTIAAVVAICCGLSATALAKEPAGKIPVTTSSDEARELYIKARDLNERLKGTDAHKVFEEAVAKDASFALAYLGVAQTAGTTKDFFAALAKAVAAAPHASALEQLLIKSVEAGARNDPARQKEYLSKLTTQLPGDERAQNALGIYLLGTQDYPNAIKAFEAAIKINPTFSPPYNQVGYAYRFVDRLQDAEKAFKKYIELIPDDPNPYDSMGELLMKMGRFDDSIASYRKALAIDPKFVASLVGIGNDQMFQGKLDDARKTFSSLLTIARGDGEKRQAEIWMVVSYTHEGAWDKALAELDKLGAIAIAKNDNGQHAFDLNFAGNINLEAERWDAAAKAFDAQIALTDKADVPAEAKTAARRNHLYDEARVALGKGDLATARAKAKDYAAQVEAKKIPFEIRQRHELDGMIAMAAKDWKTAVTELARANQRDPRVLYLEAVALHGAGDASKAKAMATKAATFNELAINLGFVRAKSAALAN